MARLGTRYYRLRRSLEWRFGSKRYALTKEAGALPFSVFRHSTPLYRKLRNVDMWMQRGKVINLGIALRRLDGIVIRPGETFSYWRLIGKPTKRKGYVPGMILFYGTFRAGIGGGLCQLSNLLYWMTLHTPLRVVERHRHSYDVFPDADRTQPFGSGATCAYNYIDLQTIEPQPWGGCVRRNEIWRRTMNGEGVAVADERMTGNEAILMYEPLLKERSDA
jgi:vancomycin resistance protein VanW